MLQFALVTMAPSDSSPTKPEDGSGNGKSHHEIGAVVIQQQIDEVESDKNAEPSHDAGSFYEPGPYTLCCGPEDYDNYFDNPPWECEPSFNPPSEEDEDMYAEEEDEYNTYYCHVNNGGSLKEVCDENGHVDGGNNGEAESTRVIYVPSPKVGLVVGAVATLKYLQSNFGDRIRILRDSEVDMKRAQTPVVITGTNSQIEFVEQLIDAVLVEENHEERMEEETEKPSSQKDCDARSDEVLAEQTHLISSIATNGSLYLNVRESEMSELHTTPKKPKLKREEEEEEEEDEVEADVASRDEQEQILVALVDHRSDEIKRLKHHISNYQTKLVESEKSLRDSKAKLAHLRGHDDGVSVPSISNSKKDSEPLKTLRNVNDDESSRNLTPSKKDYPSPSRSKTLKPCDSSDPRSSSSSSISKSKAKTVVVKQKSEPSSRDSPNVKASRDSPNVKDRGTKRKFELKEHKELIRLIARNSSPTTIKCHTSNQISSQHKRKLRSLILCPVNEQLFATRWHGQFMATATWKVGSFFLPILAILLSQWIVVESICYVDISSGLVSYWRLAASLLSTTDCLSRKQRRWAEDIAWHPSGNTLFSVYTADDGDSQISILNLNKTRGLRLFDIRLRKTELHSFGWKQDSSESQSALINQSWSPDGLYITSGSVDPVIHVFDIRYNARKPTQSIKAHQKRVFKAEWHYSQPLLISISSDLNIGLHKIS
ncbi:unnamed protein product [Thlaspi arvense]|uniref:Uncharacterized protein n=1 Tax=Thlaspi arvense TaxID=13288 RepID=A0AAU9STX8_THLAR|nr:unnamed protein product [Thlaspi arvense]